MDTFGMENAGMMPDALVQEILIQLEDAGWVVLESPEGADLRSELVAMQQLFGDVVLHPFSREEGIVVVDNAYRPPRAMTPHTDGTYYPEPPAVLCLQCLRAASTGGATTLVDGAGIYRRVSKEYPDELPLLFEPVLKVRRDDRFVESSVFWRDGDRVKIRIRFDQTIKLEVAPQVERSVESIRNYIEDEANQLCFALRAGQTLVTDNTRVLHGRTAYDGREERRMDRMHLNGRGSRGTLRTGFIPATMPEQKVHRNAQAG
jgi:alpha-ketoglutarate-dependent taurine dioxygenase